MAQVPDARLVPLVCAVRYGPRPGDAGRVGSKQKLTVVEGVAVMASGESADRRAASG